MWIRADVGVTSVASRVSAWADQSTNGHNASQSTAGHQPLLVASGINGLPTIRFDTSRGDIMSVSTAVNQQIGFRMYFVGAWSGTGAYEGLLDANVGIATDRLNGKPGLGFSVTASAVTGNHLITIDAYGVSTSFEHANEVLVRVDNGAFSSSLGTAGTLATNMDLLGSMDADLSEVIVTTSNDGTVLPATPSEDAQVLSYLSSRYGLW
jgi:hypothetical protein